MTYEEKYDPAMAITDQAEADAYFEFLVDDTMASFRRQGERDKTRLQAEAIERSNLGYWAGYYDHATRERAERLYRCAHPFLGAIAETGPLSLEEIFEIGRRLGRAKAT